MHEKEAELEYEILDRYLKTMFELLEGIATVDQAQSTLQQYLEFHRSHGLSLELEKLLVELLEAKRDKEGGITGV